MEMAVHATLNFNEKLQGSLTLIWSGNGVHFIQPIEATILEQESVFAFCEKPSQQFMRFAAQYLSNHKSDPSNHPSFKSCVLRVSYHNMSFLQYPTLSIISQNFTYGRE